MDKLDFEIKEEQASSSPDQALLKKKKDELEKLAKESPEAKKWLEGKEIKRVVTIPGRLVNIVAI